MKRRQIWTSGFAALGLILLMGFQNCAPAGNGVSAGLDSNVRIVDRWQAEKVSFPVTTYYVESSVDSVNIEGLCDQSKGIAEVEWKAIVKAANGNEQTISSGLSGCQGGSFNVALEKINQELLDCSLQVEVQASPRGEIASSAKAYLKKNCL